MSSLFERLRDALAPEYELERELGAGGMGVVFLARDSALDRRVAIKIIRPELATARATERFLREARLLAQLKHPNIMPVHRAGEAGGVAYYVMAYSQREPLLLARLTPPNIMPVPRPGGAGVSPYYAMDYCEGETLQERLERGPA